MLARGHLVLGTGSTNAPWHFKSADDKLQGFDVDMGRIIAKALFGNPDKITYVNQSSDARIPNITTNKVDITCQFMTVTGERAQQVAFTIPYYREGVGLMLKADGKYADYAALKEAGSSVTVSVLQNVYAEPMVRAALPKANVDQYESVDLIYQALASGRADAVATDQSSLAWYMTQNPGRFKDAGYGWNPQTYACAVKRGDQDWLNFVNTALHEAMTGVEFDVYAKSFKTWFGRTCRRRRSASRSNTADPRPRGPSPPPPSLRERRMDYTLNFGAVWRNFEYLMSGLALSLGLAAVSIVIGAAIGALAFALTSRRLALSAPARLRHAAAQPAHPGAGAVRLFRAAPAGVRIDKIRSFMLVLSLYSGAYLAEVFRAGLLSIPRGLTEAGLAIGLTPTQIRATIIAPLMLRNVLPSLSSTIISLFKDTSLAAVIAVPELTFAARKINVESFRVIETWIVTSALYVACCFLIAAALRLIERRLALPR